MDSNKIAYRHEIKYTISASQIPVLRNRIKGIMWPDPHAGSDGVYTVRSLYFDDYRNRCFYENENGNDPREKIRIRIYNQSTERISLECKRKERGKTRKTSCSLSSEQAAALMHGQAFTLRSEHPALLKKLLLQMQMQQLKPVVIVEYERIPLVYRDGNVRVTFDTSISASSDICDFFSPRISKRPIMQTGQHLMEVKFDDFLPDTIYQSLNLEQLQQTAYSKYYLCRRFI